jgi:phage tail-like protein
MRVIIVVLAIALVVSIVGQVVGWANIGGFLAGTVTTQGGREDPLVAFKFGLEIDGKFVGYFTSVSGIGSESEVVQEKGEDPDTGETTIQAIPGRLKWTSVTLARGATSDTRVWDWRQLVVEGNVDDARADCSIIAYNQSNEKIARWNLKNAWPSAVSGPSMDTDSANSTDYMVETLTLAHEGAERID